MALFDQFGNLIPEDKLPVPRGNPVVTQAAPIEGQASRVAGLLGSEGAVAGAEGAAGAAGRGILSRLGGTIFGPVGTGITAAVTPGQLGNSDMYAPGASLGEQEFRNRFDNKIQQMTSQAANTNPGGPSVGIMGGTPAINTQATAGVAQEPGSVPAAAAMDARRNQIQRGAMAQLESNSLSRPEAAKAVVEADEARTGQPLPKEEKAARIKEETQAMRGMDNDSLSKYLGWALVGAGLIASAVDKSGMAGERFSEGFNKQLDRNQQMALYQAEAKAKAEAAAAANALKEREINNKERATEGTINYQNKRLGQFDDANSLAQAAEARKAQGMDARLGLQAAGLNLRQQELANMQDYRNAQLGIAQKKLGLLQQKADAAGGPKPVDLSTKDATNIIDQRVKALGGNIDSAAKAQAAEQLRIASKNFPGEVAKDAGGVVDKILSKYAGQSKPSTLNKITGGLLGSPSVQQYGVNNQ